MLLLSCAPDSASHPTQQAAEADADGDADADADADLDSGGDTAAGDTDEWDVVEEDKGPYREGIDGSFSAVGTYVLDGTEEQQSFTLSAQFFAVEKESLRYSEGTILDSLDGADDCGLWVGNDSGYESNGSVDWFTVDSADVVVGGITYPLRHSSGGEVENYDTTPSGREGASAPYGESFALVAHGGEYGDLLVEDVGTLPPEILLLEPALTSGGGVSIADLGELSWAGSSDELLTVLGYITGGDAGTQGWILECSAVDDGAFSLPAEVLAQLQPRMSVRFELRRKVVGVAVATDGRDIYSQTFARYLVYPVLLAE